jgi:hypothetical protein
MKFFGDRYLSRPPDTDMEHVATPVGARCAHCEEPITAQDHGWVLPPQELSFHHACFLRGVIGSVAHQQRRCSCFIPGSTCSDDPALTRRQAAEAALDEHDRKRAH